MTSSSWPKNLENLQKKNGVVKQNFHIKVRHILTWHDMTMSQYDVLLRHHVICDSQ